MRLLDRYLLRELLVPFAYCLGGFLLFWISFDLFAELSEFQRRRMTFPDIAEFYAIKTPEFLVVVLPVALLMALLYALTHHARHHEMTAMRAAGVSLGRLAMPYLGVGLLLSLALLAMNELWVPQTAEAAEALLNRHQPGGGEVAGRSWLRQFGFANTRAHRKWFAEAYNRVTHQMVRPHVEWTLVTGTRYELVAERAWPDAEGWVFTNVQERVFPAARGEFPTMTETNLLVKPEFTETPEEIQSEIKVRQLDSFREVKKAQLSIREILNYQRLHPGGSEKEALLDTMLHGRLAAPWTCLVVVLIALPFGAATGRRNVLVGVASSIGICFSYFILSQFGLALGTGGFVPSWLAAWAPNGLFAAVGLWLSWRVR